MIRFLVCVHSKKSMIPAIRKISKTEKKKTIATNTIIFHHHFRQTERISFGDKRWIESVEEKGFDEFRIYLAHIVPSSVFESFGHHEKTLSIRDVVYTIQPSNTHKIQAHTNRRIRPFV